MGSNPWVEYFLSHWCSNRLITATSHTFQQQDSMVLTEKKQSGSRTTLFLCTHRIHMQCFTFTVVQLTLNSIQQHLDKGKSEARSWQCQSGPGAVQLPWPDSEHAAAALTGSLQSRRALCIQSWPSQTEIMLRAASWPAAKSYIIQFFLIGNVCLFSFACWCPSF